MALCVPEPLTNSSQEPVHTCSKLRVRDMNSLCTSVRPPHGLPRVSDVRDILGSETYQSMKEYSEAYCRENISYLSDYKWIRDAFNQWSRICEYPYCFISLCHNVKAGSDVLDAGSGITFFPFFLSRLFKVTCVDQDDYSDPYILINRNQRADVRFIHSNLESIPIEPNSYDAVYCVSVLEHTGHHAIILKEFHRILKPGGLLIVTFDVALDGGSEGLEQVAAEAIIRDLQDAFSLNYTVNDFRGELRSGDLYTTDFVRCWDERLLPWPRYTVWRAIRDSLTRRRSRRSDVKLSFCNLTAKKT